MRYRRVRVGAYFNLLAGGEVAAGENEAVMIRPPPEDVKLNLAAVMAIGGQST